MTASLFKTMAGETMLVNLLALLSTLLVICVIRGRMVLASVRQELADSRQRVSAQQEDARHLQLALAAANVGTWEVDLGSRGLAWSETYGRLFGRQPPGFPTDETAFFKLVHPEDRARAKQRFSEAIERNQPYRCEFRVCLPDGTVRWHEAAGIVLSDAAGHPVRMVGVGLDLTERKRADEEVLRQSMLLDAANEAIYVRRLDHTITYWSAGAERMYGWTRAEALGRRFTELKKVSLGDFQAAEAAALAHGCWSGELNMTHKTGGEQVVFGRWTLLRDEHGQPVEILAICTDITEQKRLEALFLRAQRLEAIGALASGIAHDLNNILAPIVMTAPILRGELIRHDDRALLDTIENCACRGADIVKQLLTFARGTPNARVPLPVHHLLRDIEKIVQETFPRSITLELKMADNLWLPLGDATQLHQALINLCVNARDALAGGGRIVLKAENVTATEAFAAKNPGARAGYYVCLSVTDTGSGIPPEHLDRIYEPFFTTKPPGKGTGLGLPTVLGIVRGHGGFVRLESQLGHGTTFQMFFPATPQIYVAETAPAARDVPRGSGELILVVDDEPDLLFIIRCLLESNDYRVVTATEGAEGLAVFTQHRGEIRTVLTDLMMPSVDGLAMVHALRCLNPHVAVLGMTGLPDQVDFKSLNELGFAALLAKPFSNGELLEAIHGAVENPSHTLILEEVG